MLDPWSAWSDLAELVRQWIDGEEEGEDDIVATCTRSISDDTRLDDIHTLALTRITRPQHQSATA